MFVLTKGLNAQNPSWILPPNQFKDVINNVQTALPIPINPYNNPSYLNGNNYMYDGYDGQQSLFASNIQKNASGQIEFFIVDGFIFDGTGNFIDELKAPGFSGYDVAATGASEIMVIPFPDKCNKYYIVSTTVEQGNFYKAPNVFILDMNQLNQYADQSYGQFYGAIVDESGLISDPSSAALSLDDIIDPKWPETNNDPSPGKRSGVFMGCTNLKSNNTRFAFISNGDYIYIFSVNSLGFTPIDFIYFENPGFNPESLRSELEVAELADGTFRIATVYMPNFEVLPQGAVNQYIFTCDINQSGFHIPSSIKKFPLFNYISPSGSDLSSKARGLEFSSDGNTLFITHTINPISPNSLEYYYFPSNSTTLTGISQSSNYQYSFLERAFDNKIYFVDQNGLHSFNANSAPYTIINENTGVTYQPNYEGEIPAYSSHKAYVLQDQIDGMDYSTSFFQNKQCCIDNSPYDKITFSAQSSGTWTPGFGLNPLDATNNTDNKIIIKNELRIPAGKTVTIDGMTIEFAPNAKLIIENGSPGGLNGGKLILKNSILRANTKCTKEFWQGIEVWGNQLISQGNSINSSQGWLIVNNSTIQDAWVAILASKRNSLFVFDDNRNGGVVQVYNGSHISNNQRGIWFRKYLVGSNLSYVNNSSIEWNDNYFTGYSIQTLATLDVVYALNFRGTEFKNNMVTSIYKNQGYGIIARQSQFYVKDYCNSITPIGTPCPSPTKSNFLNLSYGIHATNGSDDRTFVVDNSLFNNCRYGIYDLGTKKERITSNTFAVREADYQTAGGILFSSTGYKIENNDFFEYDDSSIPNGNGNSYGLVINSSGTDHNEVYRNRFKNLKVGGQSEKINGLPISSPNNTLTTGLQWKCNSFSQNIYLTDLGVNGVIDYQQGYIDVSSISNARKMAARNTFSLNNESSLVFPDHDIMVYNGSQQFNYVFLNAPSHTPDNITEAYVSISPAQFNGTTVNPGTNDCPSQLEGKITVEKNKLISLKTDLEGYISKIEAGKSQTLINAINSNSNYGLTKQMLLEKSPFLSDNILITYLNSNAPSSLKKDVLIANCKLSDNVILTVQNSNLPIGTKNQIYQAQQSISLRDAFYKKMSSINSDYEYLYNDIVSLYLTEENDNGELTQLKQFLTEINDIKSHKTLYDIFITKKEFNNVAQERANLSNSNVNSSYFDLQSIKENLILVTSDETVVNSTNSVTLSLDNLSLNANDDFVKSSSKSILEFRDGASEIPDFLPLIGPHAMMIHNEEQESSNITIKSQIFSLYPNPSNGLIYIDYPNNKEGIIKITLNDLNGKEVYNYISEANTNGESIRLLGVENGIYLVKIYIDGFYIETHKLILNSSY